MNTGHISQISTVFWPFSLRRTRTKIPVKIFLPLIVDFQVSKRFKVVKYKDILHRNIFKRYTLSLNSLLPRFGTICWAPNIRFDIAILESIRKSIENLFLCFIGFLSYFYTKRFTKFFCLNRLMQLVSSSRGFFLFKFDQPF